MAKSMDDELSPELRDDVRFLGENLGATLRELEGNALYELVERVRALSKSARSGRTDDQRALVELLRHLDVGSARPLARAFAQFLALANIAEQHDRVRRRRRRTTASPGSVTRAIGNLSKDGVTPSAMYDAL